MPLTKAMFIQRAINRGSSPALINRVVDNWDAFKQDLWSYDMPVICTSSYLSDIIGRDSTYKYFKGKIDEVITYVFGIEQREEEDENDWPI